ncbi:bifunctional demethylmenaquinone methyltransferase/2-methoxy-6-polyprenyl-1,4-benzoquinol methylase UbiE [Chlamydiifrater phoenicopteri]|uniref:bifunctional demethylmenaquinone methyltransferase/2-methoxy-6-polyprenyl-1,4-benzoquinol methylase UbiE n=1 Tax=Chlamydiifrater phoenicopteri TaxID=2681469 RepID=UPI001BCD9311|nr:bifunctional demethylmenaquinone methyltransferase/2-methoxy-6-polyprenyl-1,4-benzoquinol methylase UbiE [Chlamydiifrater phoenicopteri]
MTKTSREIQTFFKSIAAKYDFVNSLLSLGRHHYWNHSLIQEIDSFSYKENYLKDLHMLDLCAGTGAIAFKYLLSHPNASATLIDFCPEMLAIAENRNPLLASKCTMIEQDVSSLPFAEESIPLVSMAYGLRNLKNPEKCLKEVFRVLISGGFFYMLELTKPESNLIIKKAHKLFLKTYVPLVGKLFTDNPSAYKHLRESIEKLPEIQAISKALEKQGFQIKKIRSLTMGSATIWVAKKAS